MNAMKPETSRCIDWYTIVILCIDSSKQKDYSDGFKNKT